MPGLEKKLAPPVSVFFARKTMELENLAALADRAKHLVKNPEVALPQIGALLGAEDNYKRFRSVIKSDLSEDESNEDSEDWYPERVEVYLQDCEKFETQEGLEEWLEDLRRKRPKLEPKTDDEYARSLQFYPKFEGSFKSYAYKLVPLPQDTKIVLKAQPAKGLLECEADSALLRSAKFVREELWPRGSTAAFGDQVANENRVDLEVRNARELLPGRDFEFEPGNSFYKLMEDYAYAVWGATPVTHTLQKMTLYGKGGHFAPHVDHVDSPDMLGTAVFVFPCFHMGGSLYFEHPTEGRVEKTTAYDSNTHLRVTNNSRPDTNEKEEEEEEDSWVRIAELSDDELTKVVDDPRNSKDWFWAYAYHFHGSLPHGVSPVTHGIRVALTFSVRLDRTRINSWMPQVGLTDEFLKIVQKEGPFFAALHDMIAAKRPVGFILKNKYPSRSTSFEDILQSYDKEFYALLKLWLAQAFALDDVLKVLKFVPIVFEDFVECHFRENCENHGPQCYVSKVYLLDNERVDSYVQTGQVAPLPKTLSNVCFVRSGGSYTKTLHKTNREAYFTGNEMEPGCYFGVYTATALIINPAHIPN